GRSSPARSTTPGSPPRSWRSANGSASRWSRRESSARSRSRRCRASASTSARASSSAGRCRRPRSTSTTSRRTASSSSSTAMQHSFEQLDLPGGYARVGLLRPIRHRDFRLLWAGMSVSLVGDGMFLVATAWTAYSLWNAPAALSVVGIAMSVPTIACLLVGGAVSDRYDRRKVMLLADVGRGIAIGVLTALAFAHALSFAALTAVVAVYAVGAGFFTPAFEAAVPALVPDGDLPQANALDQFVRPVAMRLAGPAL